MTLSIPLEPFLGDEALPQSVDVAVIGGGIIGLMTALNLAERGVSVAVFEKGQIAGEQSSRNWGWVRQIGRDAAELPLTMASLALWGGMNARVGAETGFRRTGISYLCYNQGDLRNFGEWHSKGRDYGLDMRMLTAGQVGDLLPGSDGRLLGALYSPGDGRAEPWLAGHAIASALRRRGGHILTCCAVRTVDMAAGHIAGVVTERGRVACSSVVLAGGVWSRLFAGNMALDVPQLKVVGTVAKVTGVDGLSDMPVGASDFAYRRRLDGGYTIARRNANIAPILPDNFRLMFDYLPTMVSSWRELKLRIGRDFLRELRMPRRWDADQKTVFERIRTLDPQPNQRFTREAMASLGKLWPAFKNARVEREWAGVIDVTPDAVPIISQVAGRPGLVLATGFSGHGFGIAPAAGQLTADLVMGTKPIVDPAPFAFARLRPA